MRTAARIFIALFCLTFLANQAQGSFSELGVLIGSLIRYTSTSIEYFEAHVQTNGSRLNAIEKQLSEMSDFRVTPAQAAKWNRGIDEKAAAFNRARNELNKLLE